MPLFRDATGSECDVWSVKIRKASEEEAFILRLEGFQ